MVRGDREPKGSLMPATESSSVPRSRDRDGEERQALGASPSEPPTGSREAGCGGSAGQDAANRGNDAIPPLQRLLDGLVDHVLRFLRSGPADPAQEVAAPRWVRALASLLGVLSFNYFYFDSRLVEQQQRLSRLVGAREANQAELAAEVARITFLFQSSALMVGLGYLAVNVVAVAVVVAYGLPKAGPVRLLLGGLFLQALTYTVCGSVLAW